MEWIPLVSAHSFQAVGGWFSRLALSGLGLETPSPLELGRSPKSPRLHLRTVRPPAWASMSISPEVLEFL